MAKNTGIAQFAVGKSDVFKVDPRLLIIDETDDYREKSAELDEHIDMLAQSIAEIGIKKPIEVKLEDGKIIVKEGRCRTRAAMRAIEHYKADLKAVPVISVDRYANDADLILNQFIGNSGKPFTSMEQAKIFKKLLDMGWNQSGIAKKTGMSNGRVSQILNLLTLPVSIQAGVNAGTISASLAATAVRSAETNGHNSETIVAAIQTAATEGRKVKPEDVAAPASQKGKTIKGCFENSDIDDSQEMMDKGYVQINMAVEDYLWLRQLFKL